MSLKILPCRWTMLFYDPLRSVGYFYLEIKFQLEMVIFFYYYYINSGHFTGKLETRCFKFYHVKYNRFPTGNEN